MHDPFMIEETRLTVETARQASRDVYQDVHDATACTREYWDWKMIDGVSGDAFFVFALVIVLISVIISAAISYPWIDDNVKITNFIPVGIGFIVILVTGLVILSLEYIGIYYYHVKHVVVPPTFPAIESAMVLIADTLTRGKMTCTVSYDRRGDTWKFLTGKEKSYDRHQTTFAIARGDTATSVSKKLLDACLVVAAKVKAEALT